MSLRTNTIPLEEQLQAIDGLIKVYRNRRGSTEGEIAFNVLKAVHANLTARLHKPRSLVLGEMEGALRRAIASQNLSNGHYDVRHLHEIANVVIRRWPFMREAIEHYGAESAE